MDEPLMNAILERLETDDHTVETMHSHLLRVARAEDEASPAEAPSLAITPDRIWEAVSSLFARGRIEAFAWDAGTSSLRRIDRLEDARRHDTWFRLAPSADPRPNLPFVRGWQPPGAPSRG